MFKVQSFNKHWRHFFQVFSKTVTRDFDIVTSPKYLFSLNVCFQQIKADAINIRMSLKTPAFHKAAEFAGVKKKKKSTPIKTTICQTKESSKATKGSFKEIWDRKQWREQGLWTSLSIFPPVRHTLKYSNRGVGRDTTSWIQMGNALNANGFSLSLLLPIYIFHMGP